MKKNLLYFIAYFLFLLFIHNLLIKKYFEAPIGDNKTLTYNLDYSSKEYKLKAKFMKEIDKRKEAEDIEIVFKDLKIKSKKFSTSDMKKLNFKEEVEIENEGWLISCNDFKYNRNKEKFKATGNVIIKNKEKDISIKANFCSSNKSFSKALFKEEIELNYENCNIKCEEAYYYHEDETFFIKKDGLITTKVNINNEENFITLKGNEITYNINLKKAFSDYEFYLAYKNFEMSGNGFQYFEGPLKFISLDKTEVINKEKNVNLKSLTFFYENDIIKFEGDIKGSYDKYFFNSNSLIIKDSSLKLLELKDNVEIINEDFKIYCEELIYNKEEDIAIIKGQDAKIEEKNFTLKSNIFNYDNKKKILNSNSIKLEKNDMKTKGKNFNYELDEGIIKLENIECNKENFLIKLGNGYFNIKDKIYELKSNISVENQDLILFSEEINVNNNIAHFKDDFKILLKNENFEIVSRDAYLNTETEEFKTVEELIGVKENYKFRTKGLVYDLKEEKIYLNNLCTIEDEDKKFKAKFLNFNFNNKTRVGFLNEIIAEDDKNNFRANKAEYRRDQNLLTFLENVRIDGENLEITSHSLNYFTKTSIVEFKEEANILKDELLFIVQKGSYNLDNYELKANDALLFTETGEILEGKELFFDYNSNHLIFNKNIEGEFNKSIGEISNIKFKANKGNIFLEKNKDEKYGYKVTRAELKYNVEFITKNINVFCDFMEYDHTLKWIYGRDNLKINVNYPDSTNAISAKYAFIDIEKEIGRMKNEVIVTHKSQKLGIINTNSNEAILKYKEKIVGLKGNVKSYGSKSDLKIYGNEAILDLRTGIIKSQGASSFTYSFNKDNATDKEIKEELLKEHKEDLEKIKKNFS